MAELIVFPDTEDAVVSYLDGLVAVPVGTKVPKVRPASFVRVLLVGGYQPTLVTQVARFAVECWADLPSQAIDLAQQVGALLSAATRDGLMGSVLVSHMSVISGPQNLPDPESNQRRITATYEFHFRA